MMFGWWIVPMTVLALSACVNIDINLFGGDDTPVVEVDDVRFEVEVADTPALRDGGLTGRDYLEERRGMLYIPEGRFVGAFWMKGMRFPLDFVWIGEDCRVVDIAVNAGIPAPGTPDDRIWRYRSYPSAAYTLEVNAGEVDRFGIRVGDEVEFENIRGGC